MSDSFGGEMLSSVRAYRGLAMDCSTAAYLSAKRINFLIVLAFLGAALYSGLGYCAIEAVSMSASGGQNDKSSYSFAHEVYASSGRLLVVGVCAIDSSEGDAPVNSVTFNGRGMTRLGNTIWKDTGSTSSNRISGTLFYQLNPDVGNFNVTVSHNGTMYGTYAWARSYKNVAGYYTHTDNSSSGSTSASTNISVGVNNSLVVDLCSIRGNTTSVTAGASPFSNGWILRGGNGDQRYNPAGSERISAAGTANMSWSFGGTQRWVHRVAVFSPNLAPTDIALSSGTVNENSGAGTAVGSFSATDPEGDSCTYSLVGGDTGAFSISGASLLTAYAFDYETKSSYTVTVRATDACANIFDKSITVYVGNVNEAPTGVGLGASTVDENAPANTLVGTLSATDPDAGDTFSYSFVTNEDNAFTIAGNELRTSFPLNYEAKNSYAIRVRATDGGGLAAEANFTISVANVNEGPADITLTSATLPENSGADYLLGSLIAVGDPEGDGSTFTLVAGEGDANNGSFRIDGVSVYTTADFDYETLGGTLHIRVQAADAGSPSQTFARSFDITLQDADEEPPNPPSVSGTASPTNDTTPEWTWSSGGGDGNGTFRRQLDGTTGAWVETTDVSFTAGPLDEGTHRLYVQERDAAGNWSVSSFFDIFLDLTGPTPPVVSGPAATNDTTPEWTWTPGGGGNGTYRYQLGSTTGAWTETAAAAFAPEDPLAEGTYRLYVQERDAVGNWSVSSFFDIFLDLTAPAPPAVGGPSITNEQKPTWTWTPGGGGAGTFQWKLDGLGAWMETTATSLMAGSDLAEGLHTLAVQERDAVGNWSVAGEFTVEIDLTPPVVTVTPQITNDTTPAVSGNATDASGITSVAVTVDGQPCTVNRTGDAWTAQVQAALGAGAHQVLAQATDAAGNTGADQTTDEIVIDFNVPGVTVNPQITNGTTPTVTGTATAQDGHVVTLVRVTIDGVLYTFTPAPAAQVVNWAITTTALEDDTYDVEVQAQDELTRTGTDGGTGELTIDTHPPTALITRDGDSPTGADSVTFTVTFDGPVAPTFDGDDVDIAGLPCSVQVVNADPVYTVIVTPIEADADGIVIASIGQGVEDLAGNGFEGATSSQYDIYNWNGFESVPEPARAYVAASHTFTVVPACDAPTGITYQWRFDNGLKSIQNGPATPAWEVNPVTEAKAGIYWCEVSYDGVPYETEPVALDVASPLAILDGPTDVVAAGGASHTFTVTPEGGFEPLTYEWYKVGQAGPVSTERDYTIASINAAHAGIYYVQVSDDNGSSVQSGPAELRISSGMPVAGLAGLAGLAAAITAAAAAAIRRRRN